MRKWALVFSISLFAAAVDGAEDFAEGWADVLLSERSRGQPLPLTTDYVPALRVREALRIHAHFASKTAMNSKIGGYKLALHPLDDAIYERLERPVTAILPADGERANPAILRLDQRAYATARVSLGFVLHSPITRAMRSVEDLLTYLDHLALVVELPNNPFAADSHPRPLDWVTVNWGIGEWIRGARVSLRMLNALDDLQVELQRGDEALLSASARGPRAPLDSLLLMVNELHRDGRILDAGQLLIVAELASLEQLKLGDYTLSVGGQPTLAFRLIEGQSSR